MKTSLLLYLLLILPCGKAVAQPGVSLSGLVDESRLDRFSWFTEGYSAYEPDSAYVASIRRQVANAKILVFAGTWCGDTHRLLPRFYKVTDAAGISRDSIDLYMVDMNIKSPEGLEETYQVTSIPAFIIVQDGRETGRVGVAGGRQMEAALLEALAD